MSADCEYDTFDFDRAWVRLAAVGMCDELGGSEYRRVRAAWERAGCPWNVYTFICSGANAAAQENAPPVPPG